MTGYQIYDQARCAVCRVCVGFKGQPAAYAGADGRAYCPRDIDKDTRIKADKAQRHARSLPRP